MTIDDKDPADIANARATCIDRINRAVLTLACLPEKRAAGSSWPDYIHDFSDHGARADLDAERRDTGRPLRFEARPEDIDDMLNVIAWFSKLTAPASEASSRFYTKPGLQTWELQLLELRAWHAQGYSFSWDSIARHMEDARMRDRRRAVYPVYSGKWWSMHHRTLCQRIFSIAVSMGDIRIERATA